jgi:hypothetical protein
MRDSSSSSLPAYVTNNSSRRGDAANVEAVADQRFGQHRGLDREFSVIASTPVLNQLLNTFA